MQRTHNQTLLVVRLLSYVSGILTPNFIILVLTLLYRDVDSSHRIEVSILLFSGKIANPFCGVSVIQIYIITII